MTRGVATIALSIGHVVIHRLSTLRFQKTSFVHASQVLVVNGTNPEGTNPEGTNPEGTNPEGANPEQLGTTLILKLVRSIFVPAGWRKFHGTSIVNLF
jgi:hypothetical protein